MGAGMARSLLRAGFQVRAWNRTEDKARLLELDGASVSATPAQAVAGADVVVVMLFDRDAVLEVLTQAADGLRTDALILQCSTIGPEGIEAVGALADGRSWRILDAPVLGTKLPAEQGKLVVLCSGDPALLDTAQPVFDGIGSRTVWAGDRLGLASALKLACNAWVGTITAAAAQSLALAKSAGLDPQLVLDTIKGGALDSPYLQAKGAMMINGEYPVAFAVDGARKDLDLIVAQAGAHGVTADLLLALRSIFGWAAERGHGAEDMAAVYSAF